MAGSLSFIEIMLVQNVLQQRGYYHGPVDGNLNESARQALMGFQKDGGLEVTGELDDDLFGRFLALRQERLSATNQDHLMSRANSLNVLLKNSQELRSEMLCMLTVSLIAFLYFTA